mmetsp:Transcript_29375/g.49767  ORF Transcript_29375/g.49767 Transcript_29375/m.49767 type:complete len:381 (-) Transcript_29375:306-1448(-)
MWRRVHKWSRVAPAAIIGAGCLYGAGRYSSCEKGQQTPNTRDFGSRQIPNYIARTVAPVVSKAEASSGPNDYDDSPLDEYEDTSVEAEISRSLQTGDVLIFDRNIYEMDPWKWTLRVLAKYVNGSNFDHVAVVIRDKEDDYPYIFQVLPSGPSLTPYDETIIRSSAREIVVKRLNFKPEPKNITAVDELVSAKLNACDAEYTWSANMNRVLSGVITNPTTNSRVVVMGRIEHLGRAITRLGEDVKKWDSYKASTGDLSSKQGRQNEFIRRKRLKTYVADYRASKKELAMCKEQLEKLNNPEDKLQQYQVRLLRSGDAIFPSAAAVAEVLACLGVIPKDTPHAKEYVPKHFLRPDKMPLAGDAEFLPDVYLRSSNKGGRRS